MLRIGLPSFWTCPPPSFPKHKPITKHIFGTLICFCLQVKSRQSILQVKRDRVYCSDMYLSLCILKYQPTLGGKMSFKSKMFSVGGTWLVKACENSVSLQWWKQNNQSKRCSELVFVDSLVLQELVLHGDFKNCKLQHQHTTCTITVFLSTAAARSQLQSRWQLFPTAAFQSVGVTGWII